MCYADGMDTTRPTRGRRTGTNRQFWILLSFVALLAVLAALMKLQFKPGGDAGTIDDPESIGVFVNKAESLPAGYVPPDLVKCDLPSVVEITRDERLMRAEAAAALKELFEAAKADGYTLYILSGYRSGATQKAIYERVKKQKGEEYANLYVALPGHSEHQTGLAMDITNTEHQDDDNDKKLGEMPEGIWLRDNAHRFGFILRYPEDKTDITGYSYEPWHFRYVGREMAAEIHENGWTLEEYMEANAPQET